MRGVSTKKRHLRATRDGKLSNPSMPTEHIAERVCACKHETIGGKSYLMQSASCPTHGVSRENLAFAQDRNRKQSHLSAYYSGGK